MFCFKFLLPVAPCEHVLLFASAVKFSVNLCSRASPLCSSLLRQSHHGMKGLEQLLACPRWVKPARVTPAHAQVRRRAVSHTWVLPLVTAPGQLPWGGVFPTHPTNGGSFPAFIPWVEQLWSHLEQSRTWLCP